jgi:hypothetical protein
MNEAEFKAYLSNLDSLGCRQSICLTEACAIAYYQHQTEFPIIDKLLTYDAPQFKPIKNLSPLSRYINLP